ncbi:MAG: HEPN domain-containing protein [Anaerolineales bacterium]|jgi:HEPN domain-containing protein|nr:HEPN domain-containing protein [Anaerolineales bacterium]
MRAISEEWVVKAEDDYRSAEALLYEIEVPVVDTACFHCQQSAEKYVKAFLVEHDIDFPRNHNLMQLLELCLQADEDFLSIRMHLQSLEHYAVTIRYPGLTVPLEFAEEAFQTASHIRTFVRKKLKTR